MTLEIQVLYRVPICKLKNIAVHDSIARLNFYQHCRIRPILKTLVLRSIFPFCSIWQLLYHVFFYIAVCDSVTSTAFKRNHKQK